MRYTTIDRAAKMPNKKVKRRDQDQVVRNNEERRVEDHQGIQEDDESSASRRYLTSRYRGNYEVHSIRSR